MAETINKHDAGTLNVIKCIFPRHFACVHTLLKVRSYIVYCIAKTGSRWYSAVKGEEKNGSHFQLVKQ